MESFEEKVFIEKPKKNSGILGYKRILEDDKNQKMIINVNNFESDDNPLRKKKPKSKCKKFKNWNIEEDNLLLRLFRIYGNKWKIIVKYFPNRTAYQLNYRVQKLLQDQNNQKDFDNNSLPETTQTDTKYNYNTRRIKRNDIDIQETSFFENFEMLKHFFEDFQSIKETKQIFSSLKTNFDKEILKNNTNKSFSNSSGNLFKEDQHCNYNKNSNFNLELNESKNEIFNDNLGNFSLNRKDSTELKEILNYLGFFLKDVNNLSVLYKEKDVYNHLLILQTSVISTYMSLIDYMIINKKFFL